MTTDRHLKSFFKSQYIGNNTTTTLPTGNPQPPLTIASVPQDTESSNPPISWAQVQQIRTLLLEYAKELCETKNALEHRQWQAHLLQQAFDEAVIQRTNLNNKLCDAQAEIERLRLRLYDRGAATNAAAAADAVAAELELSGKSGRRGKREESEDSERTTVGEWPQHLAQKHAVPNDPMSPAITWLKQTYLSTLSSRRYLAAAERAFDSGQPQRALLETSKLLRCPGTKPLPYGASLAVAQAVPRSAPRAPQVFALLLEAAVKKDVGMLREALGRLDEALEIASMDINELEKGDVEDEDELWEARKAVQFQRGVLLAATERWDEARVAFACAEGLRGAESEVGAWGEVCRGVMDRREQKEGDGGEDEKDAEAEYDKECDQESDDSNEEKWDGKDGKEYVEKSDETYEEGEEIVVWFDRSRSPECCLRSPDKDRDEPRMGGLRHRRQLALSVALIMLRIMLPLLCPYII